MMNRRGFLTAGTGMMLATRLPAVPSVNTSPSPEKKLCGFSPIDLRRIRIAVGAERPFKAVHVSDTHIVRVDATEKDPRKVQLAAKRYPHMAYGEHYLAEAVLAARRDNALLLHTGDMIDFVSNANLNLVERYFGSDDWFVSSGNHEFSKYVGEAREDAAYKADKSLGITWPAHYALPPYDTDGSTLKQRRVFMQDYMTIANFVLSRKSLQNAYVTVPDLRYLQISLGMSVDLEWQTGLTFDVILGQ